MRIITTQGEVHLPNTCIFEFAKGKFTASCQGILADGSSIGEAVMELAQRFREDRTAQKGA